MINVVSGIVVTQNTTTTFNISSGTYKVNGYIKTFAGVSAQALSASIITIIYLRANGAIEIDDELIVNDNSNTTVLPLACIYHPTGTILNIFSFNIATIDDFINLKKNNNTIYSGFTVTRNASVRRLDVSASVIRLFNKQLISLGSQTQISNLRFIRDGSGNWIYTTSGTPTTTLDLNITVYDNGSGTTQLMGTQTYRQDIVLYCVYTNSYVVILGQDTFTNISDVHFDIGYDFQYDTNTNLFSMGAMPVARVIVQQGNGTVAIKEIRRIEQYTEQVTQPLPVFSGAEVNVITTGTTHEYHFVYNAIEPDLTDQPISLFSGVDIGHLLRANAYITAIVVQLNNPITAGSVLIQPTIEGTALVDSDLDITLDNSIQEDLALKAAGDADFLGSINEKLGCLITTSSDLAFTGDVLSVNITIETTNE